MMTIIAWTCLGTGFLGALGVAWLVGFWYGCEHDIQAAAIAPLPVDAVVRPFEQLCLDAISYFLCCEHAAVSARDIYRYVERRTIWVSRIRVERALRRLLAQGVLTTAASPSGGVGFRWAL